jgi:hypothetical protein
MASSNPLPHESNIRIRDLLSKLPKLGVTGFPQNLETFTLFPKLLIELRLKIWGHAASQARTLHLTTTWDFQNREKRGIEGDNKVPAILHACSEARQEGLKHYTACTKRCESGANGLNIHPTRGHVSELILCPDKKVYVNFGVDRFLRDFEVEYDDNYLEDFQLEQKDLAKIQHLDIAWEIADTDGLTNRKLLHVTEHLRQMNLVLTSYIWLGDYFEDAYLPNTVGRELCMEIFEKDLIEDMQKRRGGNWCELQGPPDETAEDWQLIQGATLGCKWTFVPEELDLPPISAGATAGYIAAGGCDESMLSWDLERNED